jgi:hypothetical protein
MHGGEDLCIHGFGVEIEENKPSGRPRFRVEDDDVQGLQERQSGREDWICVGMSRGSCANESSGSIKTSSSTFSMSGLESVV